MVYSDSATGEVDLFYSFKVQMLFFFLAFNL